MSTKSTPSLTKTVSCRRIPAQLQNRPRLRPLYRYRHIYAICLNAIGTPNALNRNIRNNIARVTPVETFLSDFAAQLQPLFQNLNPKTYNRIKQAIGVFWKIVYQDILGFTGQYSVKISRTRPCPFITQATGYQNLACPIVLVP